MRPPGGGKGRSGGKGAAATGADAGAGAGAGCPGAAPHGRAPPGPGEAGMRRRGECTPGVGAAEGVGPEPGGTGLSGGSPGSTRRCPLASPAGAPRPPGLLHGTTGAWPRVARGAVSRGEHKASSPWPGEPPRNEHRGAGGRESAKPVLNHGVAISKGCRAAQEGLGVLVLEGLRLGRGLFRKAFSARGFPASCFLAPCLSNFVLCSRGGSTEALFQLRSSDV